MLQFIRDQASGWIAWVIVILITIPFALFGLQQYQGSGAQQGVAIVNGTEISVNTFQQAFQTQRQQLQRIFGGQLPELYNEGRLRRDTLEQLVNDELIVQASVGVGMRVGDRQLAEAIQTLPIFNSATGYSNEQYTTFLQSRGLSAEGFETDLRRSLLSQQLITGIRRSAIVTPSQIEQAVRLENERRRFLSLRVVADSSAVPVVDEAELKAYFDSNKEQFIVPEQVKIDYIELSRKTIAEQIEPDEAVLRQLYENSQDKFNTGGQRKVSHILVQVAGDADEATVNTALEKIQALAERIRQGEDFAELAKAESEDPGSATAGGDLGFFGKGVMDPAFEASAFSLQEGQVSEPVRSSFGWHLIKLTSVTKEEVKPFEAVREDLLAVYRNEQADQIFAEQIDQLATIAFEQPESLQPAADALGVEIQSSEYFSRDQARPGSVLANPRVISVAFSPELRDDGNNSELLELGADTVVVIRAAGYQAPRPQEFADVREQIQVRLQKEAADEQAFELGKKILESLENGAGREQIAEQYKLKWSEERTLNRQALGATSPRLLEKLFKLPPPAEGTARYDGLSDAGAGYTIIALLAVETAKPGEEGAVDEIQVEQTIASRIGEQAFSALVKSTREQSEVETFLENASVSSNF